MIIIILFLNNFVNEYEELFCLLFLYFKKVWIFLLIFLIGNCLKLDGIGDMNYYKCVNKFISGCLMVFYIDEEIYKCKLICVLRYLCMLYIF